MKILILILLISVPFISFSQFDTVFIFKLKALDTANILKTDTSAVPDDVLTKKIKLMRSEKKGLNIETVIRMKINEEQEKDTSHSKEFYDKLLKEATVGRTSKLMENSLINLYRRTYTEKEIDELTAFYKTSAGKKMDKEYFLLLVQSVKDAEQLMKLAAGNLALQK